MIDLALGVLLSTYDDSATELSFKVEAGYENVYVWGSYEQPEIKFTGNPVADTDIIGLGLGFRHEISGLTLYIEAGYGLIDESLSEETAHEMVYTELVRNHAVEGRTVPVSGAYGDEYNSSYSIDDAWIGRVGIRYEVMDHVEVSASYKAMKADQEYAIWDDDSGYPDSGYWREDNTYDFSAFEVGIFLRF